jgi:ankyrin repeat protein
MILVFIKLFRFTIHNNNLFYFILIKELSIYLLNKGASPELTDKDKVTPLHLAVDNGDYRLVERLLERNYDNIINARDNFGWTPMHIAALHNDTDIVQLLIEKGAKVNLKDSEQNTPLTYAVLNKAFDVTHILRKNGGKESNNQILSNSPNNLKKRRNKRRKSENF